MTKWKYRQRGIKVVRYRKLHKLKYYQTDLFQSGSRHGYQSAGQKKNLDDSAAIKDWMIYKWVELQKEREYTERRQDELNEMDETIRQSLPSEWKKQEMVFQELAKENTIQPREIWTWSKQESLRWKERKWKDYRQIRQEFNWWCLIVGFPIYYCVHKCVILLYANDVPMELNVN